MLPQRRNYPSVLFFPISLFRLQKFTISLFIGHSQTKSNNTFGIERSKIPFANNDGLITDLPHFIFLLYWWVEETKICFTWYSGN